MPSTNQGLPPETNGDLTVLRRGHPAEGTVSTRRIGPAELTPLRELNANDGAVEVAASVVEKITGRELLPQLGEQYKDCFGYINVSDRLGTYNKETERGVMLEVRPIGPNGWRDGQGFWVTAYFTAVKGLDRGCLTETLTPENFFDFFLIARAMILTTH